MWRGVSVAIEAIIAWLDAGKPDPDLASTGSGTPSPI
jgi:hypothetical protein